MNRNFQIAASLLVLLIVHASIWADQTRCQENSIRIHTESQRRKIGHREIGHREIGHFDVVHPEVESEWRRSAAAYSGDFSRPNEDISVSVVSPAAFPPTESTSENGKETSEFQQGCSCGCLTNSSPIDCCEKARGGHKGLFYANDFDYLCDSDCCRWWPGDGLKNRRVGGMTLDIGGQYRARYHREQNHRGLGLTGNDDSFLLHRTRVYVDAKSQTGIRFYGEMLDAESNYENFNPRPIEVNRYEVQNLFVDALLTDTCCGDLSARVGRQELLYGAQRLVSPLDWGNTRLTFEGGKLMWQSDRWDVDAFWVRPMRRDTNSLDPPNLDQQMYGVYSSYNASRYDALDMYWLAVDFDNTGARYDTVGTRLAGSNDSLLYEFEAAVQFGDNADNSAHSGGFFTTGLGRKMACLPWQPQLWFYYDWASGDNTQGNGFHHYFPLAHKYLGFMDLFGRRNIKDANVLLKASPTDRLDLVLWYHYFRLENGTDVPYNVNMTPFAGLANGTPGSKDLGHEIDVLLNYSINARMSMLFGYSRFFSGNFYNSTAGAPFSGNADFLYSQFTFNF